MKYFPFFFLFVCALQNAGAQTAPIITTIAGNHTMGYSGDGGPATDAQLNYVWGLAVDEADNVYISDLNRTIRKVSGGIITTFAGNDTLGFSGDGGPATAAKIDAGGGFITLDKKGNVYFTDVGNNRVRKVNTAGIISTFAGNML